MSILVCLYQRCGFIIYLSYMGEMHLRFALERRGVWHNVRHWLLCEIDFAFIVDSYDGDSHFQDFCNVFFYCRPHESRHAKASAQPHEELYRGKPLQAMCRGHRGRQMQINCEIRSQDLPLPRLEQSFQLGLPLGGRFLFIWWTSWFERNLNKKKRRKV